MVIPIDGPAGAGKSTQIHRLKLQLQGSGHAAQALSGGHLYRALAMIARLFMVGSAKTASEIEPTTLVQIAKHYYLAMENEAAVFGQLPIPIGYLRDPETVGLVSHVSTLTEVRAYVDERIRVAVDDFEGISLVDGRDGGTVVFPEAPLKIWLTASDEVAAKRLGVDVTSVTERNRRDRERGLAPMIPAEDAVAVDTSDLDEDEVFDILWELVQKVL